MQSTEMQMRHPLLLALFLAAGCSPGSTLPKDVVVIPDKRPEPGYEYALPGPLHKAGPFKTPLEALLHACPRLMALPDAVAKRRSEVVRHGSLFIRRSWDEATEYCAWIYYTPKKEYEISWIATNAVQSKGESRSCDLPLRVIDPRYVDDPDYPDKSIMYALAIHSHPVPSILTKGDIRYIINAARRLKDSWHDNGRIKLGIVAFFSQGDSNKDTCDGFFQYTLHENEVQAWTANSKGVWSPKKVATAQCRAGPREPWKPGSRDHRHSTLEPPTPHDSRSNHDIETALPGVEPGHDGLRPQPLQGTGDAIRLLLRDQARAT